MRRGLAVLAAALAFPSAVAAQDPPLRSLSDTLAVPTGASASEELAILRPRVCARIPTPRPRGLSKRRAVAGARAHVKLLAGGTRYKKLLARKELRKADDAETLAAASLPKSPAAALLALLAAADRAPKDPLHLLNASTLLTRFGKPYEALELLKAAGRLRPPARPPMGIDFRALAMNNEGFALIALRRFSDAERVLKRAIAREPLLAEAKLNLAAARLCRGDTTGAIGPYVEGRRRQAFPGQIELGPLEASGGPAIKAAATGATNAYVPPDRALDLSQGQEWGFPALRFPESPEAGVAGWRSLEQVGQRAEDRHRRTFDEMSAANSDLIARLFSPQTNPLTAARTNQVMLYAFEWRRLRPDLKALEDAVTATHPRYLQIYEAWWQGEYIPRTRGCQDSTANQSHAQFVACMRAWCPSALQTAHGRWLDNAKESHRAMRALMAELSRYQTAVAANLRDPGARQLVIKTFEQEIFHAYFVYVLHSAKLWNESLDSTQVKEGCMGPDPQQPSGEDGEAATPGALACPEALKTIKFNFSIGFIKIALSCEQVQASVSTPGPVGAFAQVGYKFETGTTAMFVGAGAGHSIPGISGGVKVGVYMNFDSRGNPTDTGLRGTAGAGVPAPQDLGPSIGGQVDISLAGVFL